MAQSIRHYVYELRHPETNNVYYVGKGNSRRSRYNDHVNEAYRLIDGRKVQNNIRAGKTRKLIEQGLAPLFVKVFETLNENTAFEKEIELILHYGRININTGTLSNLTEGGEGVSGWEHTDEAKAKISKAHTGRKMSEKQKQQLSEIHTGMKHTEQTKQKISISSKARIHSDETKDKMSQSHTGLTHSDKTKDKMSKSKSGTKNPRHGKTGPTSDAHRTAMKLWWAERKMKKENNK
jgi:hypothetical protein